MTSASAAFAPAVKPSRPGSARGLRVIACMMAPETPSAAPTRIAASSRGKRISWTIFAFSFNGPNVKAFQTSRVVVSAAPNVIAIQNIPKKRTRPSVILMPNGIRPADMNVASISDSVSEPQKKGGIPQVPSLIHYAPRKLFLKNSS